MFKDHVPQVLLMDIAILSLSLIASLVWLGYIWWGKRMKYLFVLKIKEYNIKLHAHISATPFCSGVYGHVVWCCIPWSERYAINVMLAYSIPLSDLNTFTIAPNWVRTALWKSLKQANTSFFFLIKYNQLAGYDPKRKWERDEPE